MAQHANLASDRASTLLAAIDQQCRRIAARTGERIVVLSSSPLLGWGREAGLKILEMTAGRFPVVTETYLGLRHGPMSFLRPDTLVLCLLSNDPVRRLYEVDLIAGASIQEAWLSRSRSPARTSTAGFLMRLFPPCYRRRRMSSARPLRS